MTVPSTAAPSNAVGARSARRRLEGSSRSSADLSRHNLVCGGSKDPNHDAVIRIGCEAPKRRGPILCYGVISHGVHRATATSNRHRRPVTSGRGGPKLLGAFCVSSLRGAQNDAVRHDTLPHEPPQGDQKLTRQGHDHSLATATGVFGAGSKPLRLRGWHCAGRTATPWNATHSTLPTGSPRLRIRDSLRRGLQHRTVMLSEIRRLFAELHHQERAQLFTDGRREFPSSVATWTRSAAAATR